MIVGTNVSNLVLEKRRTNNSLHIIRGYNTNTYHIQFSHSVPSVRGLVHLLNNYCFLTGNKLFGAKSILNSNYSIHELFHRRLGILVLSMAKVYVTFAGTVSYNNW